MASFLEIQHLSMEYIRKHFRSNLKTFEIFYFVLFVLKRNRNCYLSSTLLHTHTKVVNIKVEYEKVHNYENERIEERIYVFMLCLGVYFLNVLFSVYVCVCVFEYMYWSNIMLSWTGPKLYQVSSYVRLTYLNCLNS